MKITAHQAGLVLGVSFAIYHALWVIATAVGLGALLLDWVQSLHFVSTNYQLLPFDLIRALIGVAAAFVVGYVMGWIFGWSWQKVK